MSEPRFVMTELTGYAIGGTTATQTAHWPTTDYFVQDRDALYRVVARFVAKANGRPTRYWRQKLAERECARLNEWDAQEAARG